MKQIKFHRFKKKSLTKLCTLLPRDYDVHTSIKYNKLFQCFIKTNLPNLHDENTFEGHTGYILYILKFNSDQIYIFIK